MDGNLHLIYDKVEWATQPNSYFSRTDGNTGFYNEGEALEEIEPVDN